MNYFLPGVWQWHLSAQAKVYKRQLSVGRDQEVAGVRVRVEVSRLKQLHQKALYANGGEPLYGLLVAVGQLFALDPLGNEHLARGLVHLGDVDTATEFWNQLAAKTFLKKIIFA
jgi:hypothetical protein